MEEVKIYRKRLSFSTIAPLLDYEDNRAVKAWCKRNSVPCFKEGKCWYVYEDDYNNQTNRPPEVKKTSNFEKIGLKKYIPKTSIGQALEKKFSHIKAA